MFGARQDEVVSVVEMGVDAAPRGVQSLGEVVDVQSVGAVLAECCDGGLDPSGAVHGGSLVALLASSEPFAPLEFFAHRFTLPVQHTRQRRRYGVCVVQRSCAPAASLLSVIQSDRSIG